MPQFQKYYKTPIIFLNSTNKFICYGEYQLLTVSVVYLINWPRKALEQ